MTVSFVCRTESTLPPERLFDLARSVDAHVESQRGAGAGHCGSHVRADR
ncbi:hypothetical protein ACVWY0_003373 [Arthrobacter sp. UYNi723]